MVLPDVQVAEPVAGEAVADLVSTLNPRSVVICGRLAGCEEVLLSGIREKVYLRTAPLATQRLSIRTSTLSELAGVAGLALITADHVLGPQALDRLLASTGGPGATSPAPQLHTFA